MFVSGWQPRLRVSILIKHCLGVAGEEAADVGRILPENLVAESLVVAAAVQGPGQVKLTQRLVSCGSVGTASWSIL